MKKLSAKLSKFFFSSLLLLGSNLNSSGQTKTCIDSLLMNKEYACQLPLITAMRNEGKTDRQIYDFIDARAKQNRKQLMKYQDIQLTRNSKGQIIPLSCSGDNLGVESGGSFGAWTAQTMTFPSSGWVAAALPEAGRIVTVSTPSNDPCGDLPGKPIQLPSPYGGNYSIRLGNNNLNEAERLSYTFTVQPADSNFVYQYAAVLEDPGHLPEEQPFFDFIILDKNGDTIPCSYQHYVAGPGLPGFYTSNVSNSNCNNFSDGSPVYYSPWTLVGVNLGSYIGQQVTVVCITADCSLGGHFGYTYLDFSCGAITKAQYCLGEDSVSLSAPAGSNFSYNWSTGQTTANVIVNPQLTQTVTVHVTQSSTSCGFDLAYQLSSSPTVLTPAIAYTVNCTSGLANFEDNSSVTGGTITAWNWQFPGFTPSSSTAQNPGMISFSPGTHTISLTITSQAGCTKTTTQSITPNAASTAQFTYSKNISCDGVNVTFAESSLNTSAWEWNFGDGNTSSDQNPVHSYLLSDTYNVSLVAISGSCRDTLTLPLIISSGLDSLKPPNVFTPNDDGQNDCFLPPLGSGSEHLKACFSLEIFDRWGVKMFESIDMDNCWNGNNKQGNPAIDGTYYYIAKLGETANRGYITLIR